MVTIGDLVEMMGSVREVVPLLEDVHRMVEAARRTLLTTHDDIISIIVVVHRDRDNFAVSVSEKSGDAIVANKDSGDDTVVGGAGLVFHLEVGSLLVVDVTGFGGSKD